MENVISGNHSILYFVDGNIVIGCRNSAGGMTYFRVHKGYLASQSTVVSDMLTLPNDQGNHDTHDGAPLVNFPDSINAEVMATFLTFFYEPSHDILTPDDTDLAYKLFDVIVLADMLMVDKLKKSILDRIRQDWAIPTLEEWQRRFTRFNAEPNKWFYHFYEPASIIRVAQRFDETLLTPLQFFELSFRDHLLPYRLVPPLSRDYGYNLPDDRPNPGARWELITPQDKYRAGHGHRLFLEEFRVRLNGLLCSTENWEPRPNEPCQQLKDGQDCQTALKERVQDMTLDFLRGCHPFKALAEAKLGSERNHFFPDGASVTVIHDECADRWDRVLEETLVHLFNKIPLFYTELE
ncbi:hypothetical protein CPB83DRAFT_835921 [Crepidotus variabilis]|uniref:BTB domain-containing protein n=1 Tax=Crepidotus variabilis TaxID=179855 RepID=A0A9P6EET3_9AGAR|nr:hypothetical protein CPB83DRAFT_835921 [Crepidotus variabilis]